jgi:hypothetical protein
MEEYICSNRLYNYYFIKPSYFCKRKIKSGKMQGKKTTCRAIEVVKVLKSKVK